MQHTNLNIELIEAYIRNEVNAQQALLVEKMIATDSAWRDVYEGLLVAEEQHISIDEQLNQIEDKLFSSSRPQQQVKTISLSDWKRFATMAAAMAGIVFIGYGALKLVEPYAPMNGGYAVNDTEQTINENDAIRIIEPNQRPRKQNKTFNPNEDVLHSNLLLKDEETLRVENSAVARLRTMKTEGLSNTIQLGKTKPLIQPEQIKLVQLPTTKQVGSYANLLAYYGYKEVHFNERPTLMNTTRGANQTNEHIARVQQHAYRGLTDYFAKQEKDYIARFPFSGIVTIEFTVDTKQTITDYKVIESPNEEMSKVVIEMLQKTPWQTPINERGKAVNESLMANVSFGNTIFIRVD